MVLHRSHFQWRHASPLTFLVITRAPHSLAFPNRNTCFTLFRWNAEEMEPDGSGGGTCGVPFSGEWLSSETAISPINRGRMHRIQAFLEVVHLSVISATCFTAFGINHRPWEEDVVDLFRNGTRMISESIPYISSFHLEIPPQGWFPGVPRPLQPGGGEFAAANHIGPSGSNGATGLKR